MGHLIELHAGKRYDALQAMNHPWFAICWKYVEENDEEKDKNDENVIENLKIFKKTSKLKSVALNILVKMLPPSEIDTLK